MAYDIKYFIYARKSSEGEDRQILSIEGQLSELKRIVERDSLKVVDVYTESKSAHVPDNRSGFTEMIKRIRKGEANGIIAWHLNRISRNPKESGEIQQMLQDGKIVSIVVPHREYRSEDNALFFSIEASEANQYSRDLSVNVKRGLRLKYEMGQPPGIAPLGYLNTKSNVKGGNKLLVDPERWDIVRKGFDLLLSQQYSVREIREILTSKYGLRTRFSGQKGGKPLSHSAIYRMFTDPFYCGLFYRKGVLYKGTYKPMITVHEFDKIQIILGRKTRPRRIKHQFAYTGLIRCGICGSSITATQKSKIIRGTGKVKVYTFYHCTHRKKVELACSERYYLPELQLENMIIDELSEYQVRPSFKEWAITIAKESYQREADKNATILLSKKEHERKIKQELSNLVDLRLCDGISNEMYLQKKNEKEKLLAQAEEETKILENDSHDWMKQVEDCLNFSVDVVNRFKNGSLEERKNICVTFGLNWVLKEKKLFIDKMEWLEPIKKIKKSVEHIFGVLEPEKTFITKGQSESSDLLRPLVRGLVNEVRTKFPKPTKENII